MNIEDVLKMTTESGLTKPNPSSNGQEQLISSTPKPSIRLSEQETNGLPILRPLYEIWEKAEQDILNRKEIPEFPTGLATLDEVLWGLHKKETTVIGGRTSHGKSSFCINMFRNLADSGQRLIYFSLEMSKEQLLEKLFCNLCEVNGLDLRHGHARQEFVNKQGIFKEWINKIKLLIDDKYGYDFNNLVKICNVIQPDFIAIDYIQMISTKGYKSKVDAIEEYVRKITELGITQNFGVIILSQINRSGVDDPNMSKFKWAGVLEEHPATCIVLNWNKKKGTYTVQIEKQRHGEVKNVDIRFEPQYSRFRDLTFDEKTAIEEQNRTKKGTGGLYQND